MGGIPQSFRPIDFCGALRLGLGGGEGGDGGGGGALPRGLGGALLGAEDKEGGGGGDGEGGGPGMDALGLDLDLGFAGAGGAGAGAGGGARGVRGVEASARLGTGTAFAAAGGGGGAFAAGGAGGGGTPPVIFKSLRRGYFSVPAISGDSRGSGPGAARASQ